MKKWLKRNLKYFFLFIFFYICIQFVYQSYNMDTYANYAFSYGILKGQIPYNDFNLLIPLFSPFFYSIGLLFSHSSLFFYIEQALLLTLLSAFFFKVLSNKAWFLLIIMILPWPIPFVYSLFPGYNFLVFFLFCLLIYYEDKAPNYIIGLLLGIGIITKQNIGILFLVINLIYNLGKLSKILSRYLFALIPPLIFLLYLIFTKSFKSFLNLSILGLFDFTNNNYFSFNYLLVIIFLGVLLFFKRKKNISYFYIIGYLSILYPVLDSYHASFFILASLFVLIYNADSKLTIKNMGVFSFIIMLFISVSWSLITFNTIKDIHVYSFVNFPFKLLSKADKVNYDKLNKYTKNKPVIYLLGQDKNAFLTILNEQEISYYTILNKGNHGFRGEEMMLNKIKNEKNKYFVVDSCSSCYSKVAQYMTSLKEYIEKNTQFIKQIGEFKIYYKGN